MNIKKLFSTNFQLPVVGFNSGAFGGLISGGSDFAGLDSRSADRSAPEKTFRILIATGEAEYVSALKDVSYAYRAFTRAGYNVDFVTKNGQPVQFRSSDLTDPVNRWFAGDETAQQKANHTQQAKKTLPGHYVAIYFVGEDPAVMENQWFRQLSELILKSNGVVAGTGSADEAIQNLGLQLLLDSGYSLSSSNSSTSASEYGSVAAEAIKTESVWLVHKGKIVVSDYENRFKIGDQIVKQLEI